MKNLFYCKNIGWIIDWSDVIRFGVIRVNVNRVRIFVIPNYRIFATNFFNFRIIFALIIFENVVASKVFTFTFCCAMPWIDPVGEIRSPDGGVKDVSFSGTVSLWDYGSDGSLWVHPSAVINIPPRSYASNISTNIQTSEWELVSITLSLSSFLVGLDNG